MKRLLLGLALVGLLFPLSFAGVTPSFGPGQNDDDGVLPRQYYDTIGGAYLLPTPTQDYAIGMVDLILPDGGVMHLLVPAPLAQHILNAAPPPPPLMGYSKPFTNPDGQHGVATWTQHPGETNLDFFARVDLATAFLEDLGMQFP